MSPFPSQVLCTIILLLTGLNSGCEEGTVPVAQSEPIPSMSTIDSSAETPSSPGSVEMGQFKEIKTLRELVNERCRSNDVLLLPMPVESDVSYMGQEQALHYARIIPCNDSYKGKRIVSLIYKLSVPSNQGNEDVLRTFYDPETELPFVVNFNITTNRFGTPAVFKSNLMWDSPTGATVILTVEEENAGFGVAFSKRGTVLKLMANVRFPDRIGMARIETRLVDVEVLDDKEQGIRSENLEEEFVSEIIVNHLTPESAGFVE